ncbi:hypothetical protein L1987_45442 [Smallanthus sonchifolius]|uniref:Uncharacterized protein n=1 Tax=Smallanthus sonchifolius TaxID=185202 RepID=A0ACB9FXL5_9ASTR|nr:hypothetical protein L1987_45442 [Smallanthus sonchifolius]
MHEIVERTFQFLICGFRMEEQWKELYEYTNTTWAFRLLLTEKKKWISKNEQFEEALAETKELLQRDTLDHHECDLGHGHAYEYMLSLMYEIL